MKVQIRSATLLSLELAASEPCEPSFELASNFDLHTAAGSSLSRIFLTGLILLKKPLDAFHVAFYATPDAALLDSHATAKDLTKRTT